MPQDRAWAVAYLATLAGKHWARWTWHGRRCRCGRPLVRVEGVRAPFCGAFVTALVNLVTTGRDR